MSATHASLINVSRTFLHYISKWSHNYDHVSRIQRSIHGIRIIGQYVYECFTWPCSILTTSSNRTFLDPQMQKCTTEGFTCLRKLSDQVDVLRFMSSDAKVLNDLKYEIVKPGDTIKGWRNWVCLVVLCFWYFCYWLMISNFASYEIYHFASIIAICGYLSQCDFYNG